MNEVAPQASHHRPAARIRMVIVLLLQVIMTVQLVALLVQGSWVSAVWLLAIMAVTSAPLWLGNRLPVRFPAEYELMAILFVFASLFLGEFHSYYERFWWWDIALHSISGLLLGLLGFLLVYMLNENRRIDIHMRPGFVALFAFAFAVMAGALWEIFEFAVDQLFGAQMQKPMLGDPSGLTDTMWDLIVDTLGAAVISGFGWWHMKRKRRSFIDDWSDRLVAKNPRLFGRQTESPGCGPRPIQRDPHEIDASYSSQGTGQCHVTRPRSFHVTSMTVFSIHQKTPRRESSRSTPARQASRDSAAK